MAANGALGEEPSGEAAAVLCPGCGRAYDAGLFAFGRTRHCTCGARVGAAVFARTFVVQAFSIPSGSMEPGLLAGDHILVDITPNIQCWSDVQNPLKHYLASLEKVAGLQVDLVLPGHRRLIADHLGSPRLVVDVDSGAEALRQRDSADIVAVRHPAQEGLRVVQAGQQVVGAVEHLHELRERRSGFQYAAG